MAMKLETGKNLKQVVTIRASPKELYEMLVDPEKHSEFSGAGAEMDPKPGGRFSHYDGSLGGIVLELVPARRIVLAWRAEDWADGTYSVARFDFQRRGAKTRLTFSQYGIPAKQLAGIRDGWKQYYWEPLKAYFEG